MAKKGYPFVILGVIFVIAALMFAYLSFIASSSPFSTYMMIDEESDLSNNPFPVELAPDETFETLNIANQYIYGSQPTKLRVEIYLETSSDVNVQLLHTNFETTVIINSVSVQNTDSIVFRMNLDGKYTNGAEIGFSITNEDSTPIVVTGASIRYMGYIAPAGIITVLNGIVGAILLSFGLLLVAKKDRKAPTQIKWEPTLEDQEIPRQPVKQTSKERPRKATRPKKQAKSGLISCRFCGEFIPADSVYCPKCYAKLK